MDTGIDVVTGAFGNVGAEISARLVAAGRTVRTLTTRTAPAGSAIEAHPLAFDDPAQLAAAFAGASSFYNTYWIRGGDRGSFERAVGNSVALITAAARAGVQRIVQFSVLHPSAESPYPYFRGKAQVESAVQACGVPAAIVRPAVIFGGDNVLIDNLAWLLRRLPVFVVPGDGQYRVRPIHVGDVAELCLAAARGDGFEAAAKVEVIDAVGPERPTFDEFVTTLRDALGRRTRIVHAPAPLALAGAKLLGAVTRRSLLTGDELMSTLDGLADADGPATGTTSLADWIMSNAETFGR